MRWRRHLHSTLRAWIPACAGMTSWRAFVACLMCAMLPVDDARSQEPGGRNLQVSPAHAADASAPRNLQRRVALVIGNSTYRDAPLVNPVNDARAIAQALQESGFTVIVRENADQRTMATALREFGDLLQSGGTGLFYYAGHGMQIKGRNYLIPIGANVAREDEVAYSAVDAQAVLDKMEAAGNPTNIMILDACRNNPFTRASRGAQAGLAQMDAPVGTLVAYATSPGKVASDGAGANGLYTQHLLDAIRQPDSKVEDVFKRVRSNVRRDSQGAQVPWESTSLEGDFYFQGGPAAVTASVPARPGAAGVAQVTQPPAPMPAPAANPAGFSVGDRWRYQVVDKFKGEVVRNYGLMIDKLLPDGSLQLNKGAQRWDPQGNLRQVRGADRERIFSVGYTNVPAVLRAGATRALDFEVENRLADGRVLHESVKGTQLVKGQERIRTPAGEFTAWRVEVDANATFENAPGLHRWRFVGWYVPELRTYVAFDDEARNAAGGFERRDRHELTSFQVRGAEHLVQR